MPAFAADDALTFRINQARAELAEPVTREEVQAVLEEVLGTLEGDITALDLKLYRELEGLARYIQTAKEEIAALQPQEISQTHLVTATDELDAVVGATEEATGEILDAVERIQTLSEDISDDDLQGKLVDQTIRVFEACNFQDITGQRISKVVKALKHIEHKVNSLVAVLGEEVARTKAQDAEAQRGPLPSDEDLLNGPQLPSDAISQDEIDRLLAEFD